MHLEDAILPIRNVADDTEHQKLLSAMRVARAGSFTWDSSLELIEWSEVCATMHGFSSEVAYLSLSDFVAALAPIHRDRMDAALRASFTSLTPIDVSYCVLWPDGSEHWVHMRGDWQSVQHSDTRLFTGIALEADDLQGVKTRLDHSENRLREVQAASQIGLWEWFVEGSRLNLSREFERICGLQPNKLPSGSRFDHVFEQDRTMVVEAFNAARKGAYFDVEFRIWHGISGEVRWLHGRGRGVFDKTGTLERMVGSIHDITRRKTAELAILEGAQFIRGLAQASPSLIFRGDLFGRITYANDERWSEFTGRPAGAWRGRRWLDAVHDADRDRVEQAWHNAVRDGGELHAEYRFHHLNGQLRWILLHAVPLISGGEAQGFIGTGTDITALKVSERERANLQMALAESQKLEAIGTLASGVAHDFNNMLAAVSGFVELAVMESRDNEVATEFLQQAQNAISQATEVTSGLLTFARGSAADRVPLCLNDLLREHMSLLKQLLPASIDVAMELAAEPIWVYGDSTQLRQVLVNLVVNARDAMPDGGRLLITLRQDATSAEIQVRDDGMGMSAAVRDRVFEPFFTTKEHGQGTGLGLSVVHGIVVAHSGEIGITSQQGVGTSIWLRLPITLAEYAAATQPSPHVAAMVERILLVEDNDLVRESFALRLASSSFEVFAVPDSESALSQLRALNGGVDVALLDVDLPGENGVTLAARIREEFSAVAIIYVTGNLQNGALQRATQSDPIIAKPIDYDVLFEQMSKVVSAKRNGPA